MSFINRIKNLWELSEYRIMSSSAIPLDGAKILKKDFPTIEKKMAVIIPEVTEDPFKDENNP